MKENKKPWEYGKLCVGDNKKYLRNGKRPFFWMGDTAWLLFHQLTLNETYIYLKNRKEKGFNVILADFIHKENQVNHEQSYAFIQNNCKEPDVKGSFWSHIDQVISMAEELGLYMGILPVWGSSVIKSGYLNMDNVEAYTRFITKRYANRPNIIWITGGDIRADVNLPLFVKMGEMLKQANPDYLVGFHPFGRTSSSIWLNEQPWLDFNMFQSGHRRYDQVTLGAWDDNKKAEDYFGEDNWRYVITDHSKSPLKPSVDGEPSYELILQGLHDESQPYWEACDVRRYAYWAVFAGAMGHTYGDNSVMQFYKDRAQKPSYGAKDLWHEAIHHAGSSHMKHLVKLMNSVNYASGFPAEDLLLSVQEEKYNRICIFASDDFIFCYDYAGTPFKLNLQRYKEKKLEGYWLDPTTGVYSFFGEFTNKDELYAVPPTRRNEWNDWVLVIRTK